MHALQCDIDDTQHVYNVMRAVEMDNFGLVVYSAFQLWNGAPH